MLRQGPIVGRNRILRIMRINRTITVLSLL